MAGFWYKNSVEDNRIFEFNFVRKSISNTYILLNSITICLHFFSDFTTTVIHPLRSPADGTTPDQDSDFDDFSDGDSKPNSEDGSTSNNKPAKIQNSNGHNVVTVTTGHSGSSVNGFFSGSISNSSSGFASTDHDPTGENEISEMYYQEKMAPKFESVPSIGQCRALYDYSANMYDELSIHVGDIINIHDKQEDGWWLGELKGRVGIFPATYVEDIAPKRT